MVLGRNTRRIDAGYPKPASLSPRRRLLGTTVSRPDPRLVHQIWMSWPRIRPPPPPQKSQDRGRGLCERCRRTLRPCWEGFLVGQWVVVADSVAASRKEGSGVGVCTRARVGAARSHYTRARKGEGHPRSPSARGKVSAGWEKERSRTTNPGE